MKNFLILNVWEESPVYFSLIEVVLGLCLLLQQNSLDLVMCKQQKCISHNSGGWKSKIKALSHLMFGEGLFVLFAASSHGKRQMSLPYIWKEQIGSLRPSYKETNSLPEAPSLKAITMGILEQHKCSDHNQSHTRSF